MLKCERSQVAIEHQEVRGCDVMELQMCIYLIAKHRSMCHTWPNGTMHATVSHASTQEVGKAE